MFLETLYHPESLALNGEIRPLCPIQVKTRAGGSVFSLVLLRSPLR